MPVKSRLDPGATFRLAAVGAFVLACAVFCGYLWVQAGGSLPGLASRGDYTVSFRTDNVVNAVPFADVHVAGVPVGKIETITREGDRLTVRLALDDVVAPLHDGATVQISEKSLAGQPVVDLVDGTGPPIASGTLLPDSAVVPAVTLRDVLASLDEETLAGLGGSVQSLAVATDGRAPEVRAMLQGLSDLGRNGDTAVEAIASQSHDLELLSTELTRVFAALDTGRGRIADLVTNADTLTGAIADQRANLEDSMRALPETLRDADATAKEFDRISAALAPVTADLREAAPALNRSLERLPPIADDLRGLVPSLDGVLDRAPATLDRIPDLGENARDLVPPATGVLRDLNPALRYLEPYGLDIAQLITNFGAAFHHYGPDGGSYVYLKPYFTPLSVRPDPVELPTGNPLNTESNPYPAPGGLADLRPFSGEFPRVERDGE